MAKSSTTIRTEIAQKQRTVLEQQRLLGMMLEKNGPEMDEYIDIELNRNQVLEKKNDENDDEPQGENNEQPRAAGEASSPRNNNNESNNDGDDDTAAWYRWFANNRSPDDEYYGPTAVSEKTLQETLIDQLGELELDETQQVIAEAIVGNLDDDGYLRRSAAEIADDVTFNDGHYVNEQQVNEMIATIQTLDPPGIAARNLQECLLLQLRSKRQTPDVETAITIIEKYLAEVGAARYDVIARKMNLDEEKVREVFEREIRRGLYPRPGSTFPSRSDVIQQITPDFDVEIDDETGRITVSLHNKIPELQISKTYEDQNNRYKQPDSQLSIVERKEKKTIVEAYQRASLFIEVLKQRQDTLFRTMSAIVKCQADYFASGDERDLRPLGQQEIADMIGKDVTVVSRAINNKYVQMPWGVKSLKSFFSEDINGESRHKVYDDLKKLVDNEDKKHPLSDDALCLKLKEMGYQLERRTVAKYRGTLKIPSSTERRKMAK